MTAAPNFTQCYMSVGRSYPKADYRELLAIWFAIR
ncbi:hypothetical protein FRAHR75_540034 [Frankia sp. Hr75.2]|nr:hypothetical protein FRAHR75_540034 [Frankia sp. Hr75.2]